MKERKKQLMTMLECLILGFFILFADKLPYGTIILLAIGWYKLILGGIMFVCVVILGIATLLDSK